MRVHVLQHVPFEGVGCMAVWLESRSADVSYTRFYESTELPEVADIDLVIIMGGPMNVPDEKSHPWLVGEKAFVRSAMAAGVSVLGVCLGAQLIADVLGSRIYPNQHREIGWFSVEAVAGSHEVFSFPQRMNAFHWHGDTFDLPAGAVHLARSESCENQAFQVGRNVIGLQFHLETTAETTELMIENCPGDLAKGCYVQSADAMRESTATSAETANRVLFELLDYITS
ncbi:MAG: amidotransferase [Verrucomicrobiales bacterium]|nr:amidotransferase [Verrucomicrobiales bacterium]